MQLIKYRGRYVFNCTFHEKNVPKDAGFKWDASNKMWFTNVPEVAKRLAIHARDPEIIAELSVYSDAEIMRVDYDPKAGVFWTEVSYDNRDWPFSLGFVYNKNTCRNETKDLHIIERLLTETFVFGTEVTPEAKSSYEELLKTKNARIKESIAAHSDLEIPHTENFSLTPIQKVVVEYAEKRNYKVLVADPPGCLSGDTVVSVNRAGLTKKYNLKYIYEQLRDLGKRKWDLSIPTKMRALKNGRIQLDEVEDVIYSGEKETYTLNLEDGKTIVTTLDHRYLTPGREWKKLSELKVGDEILVNGTDVCKECGSTEKVITSKYATYKGYCIHCMRQKVADKLFLPEYKRKGSDGYIYLTGRKYKDFPRRSKSGVLEHLYVMSQMIGRIPTREEHVHHINGIRDDNRPENLELLSLSDHAKRHSNENNFKNFTHKSGSEVVTVPKVTKIKSIEYHGVIDTYDVVMKGDEHNFVANGIIVHNSGKTPMTMGIMNYQPQNVYLICCPVNAVQVWYSHIKNWLVKGDEYEIVMLRDEGKKKAELVPYTGNKTIYITNWEQLARFKDYLKDKPINCVIGDEIHYVFNKKSQRGKAFYSLEKKIPEKLYLSGTPFDGYPEKFFHILHSLGFSGAANWFTYVNTYCLNEDGVWDKKGASNIEEFQRKLREEVMIRRPKDVVLKDLPPKIRDMMRLKLGEKLTLELNNNQPFNMETVKGLLARATDDAAFMARWRKQVSLAKVPYTIEFAEKLIEEGNKIIIFAHHKEAQKAILEAMKKYGAVHIKGGDSPKKRSEAEYAFQNDPDVRVFVGSLYGASEAITLTKADVIIQHETDWRPLKVSQAEDRGHRFGKTDTLLIYYMVADDTIDVYITQVMMKKLDVVERSLDSENLVGIDTEVEEELDMVALVKEMMG